MKRTRKGAGPKIRTKRTKNQRTKNAADLAPRPLNPKKTDKAPSGGPRPKKSNRREAAGPKTPIRVSAKKRPSDLTRNDKKAAAKEKKPKGGDADGSVDKADKRKEGVRTRSPSKRREQREAEKEKDKKNLKIFDQKQ